MQTSVPYFVGENKTLKDELIIRSIKIFDIAYVVSIYLTIGFVLSRAIDNWLGPFKVDQAQKKSTVTLWLEILLQFSMIGILTYVIRNLVEWIPFPFDGVGGYKHLQLNELKNAAMFGVIFIMFQNYLKDKLMYVSSRSNQ